MPWTEPAANPNELQRCMRHLVALSALPAAWQDYDMYQIGDSLVAALNWMVDADFVFIALLGHGNQLSRLASINPGLDSASLDHVQAMLQLQLQRKTTTPDEVEWQMVIQRTVYVLDDDAAVLRSLERLLGSANYRPVTFNHPEAFLAAAKTFETGCVLLDVHLPGMSGLAVQTQLLKIRSDLAVIVVTGQGDIQTAVRAMKAGAIDFLEKPYADHALLGSIEAAFGKESHPDRDYDVADAVRRVATLSPREREVLNGLLAGRPNKLIAYDLGISVRTVEVHRARMMERLGLRQLAEVIRLGVLAMLDANRRAG